MERWSVTTNRQVFREWLPFTDFLALTSIIICHFCRSTFTVQDLTTPRIR